MSPNPHPAWDEAALNSRLRGMLAGSEQYLREVERRHRDSPAYPHLKAEHLANVYVANYLRDKTFLASREAFLAELRSFLAYRTPVPDDTDRDLFLTYREALIRGLASDYCGESL